MWRGAGIRAGVLCLFLISLASGDSAAQNSFADNVIREIIVEGAQRIEPATVVSYLTVRPGDRFGAGALDDSLKSLFATGLFADVVLRRQGAALVVTVVENPIINRIAFEGNLRIEDDVLAAEVQLRPRVVYTRTRVQSDVQRLLEIYRRSGRFAATVEPTVIQLEQNRVDLVFEIDEGALTTVRRISFIGNRAFSDSDLRDEIQTAESRWYGFLTSDDTYDPDRLAFDRELLRRFYLAEGYADFRVISAIAELTPDREEFFITFTVEEGERYRFGTVDIQTVLPDLDPEALRGELVTEPGDWYSSETVEESIVNLTEAVGDLQYAFVDIEPQVRRLREERLINITYLINEGPRVFVERIDITGNVRTVDEVIRREMELVEGDPFNASRLRRSEARIGNLGFFERVDVSQQLGSVPDQTVITVEVQERSTGELSIGGGYSTTEGPVGTVSLRERNLLGRAQDLRLAATISGRTQEFSLSFTEPYFLDKDLSAGFDAFNTTTDNQDESSFDEDSTGFGLRLGYPLGERLRQTVRYRLEDRTIENVDSDASRFIQDQEGSTLTSLVGHRLVYDQLDSRIEPSEGYLLELGNDVAGLGGDVQYFRTTASGSLFVPLFGDTVLNLRSEAGYILGIDDDVNIADRFFVGGNLLRGFDRSGIGPRDALTDDSLGGNLFAVGTAEVAFPIGLPEEFGVRGRIFTDMGTLTELDDDGPEVLDEASLRLSVGTGLSWSSPFGPIRIDFAFPLLKEDFDKDEIFRFSFGTSF